MTILFLILLALVLVIAYPRFGAGFAVVCAVFLGASYFTYVKTCGYVKDRVEDARGYIDTAAEEARLEREAARQRISKEEVELVDFSLTSSEYSGSSFEFSGRIRNDSPQYTLTAYAVRFTLKDCDESACDVVGVEEADLVITPVPPLQARDSTGRLYFPGLAGMRGRAEFNFEVQYVEGQ